MDLLFYEKLLNCLINQVAVIDRDMNIIYQNQAFEAFISLVQREYITDLGKSAERLFTGSLSRVYSSLGECFINGSIVQQVLTLDYMGNESNFKYVIIPNYSKADVESCILIFYNITDVERKKKEMNHQVQFFSKLINRLPIGVYMFDIHNSEVQMTLWNPMMQTYFGQKEEDILGLPFEAVFNRQTVRMHHKSIEKIRETGLYYDFPSENIRTPQGLHYFHIILAPIIEENKTSMSFIGIMEDVTTKIQQEMKLKEYQNELKIALTNTSRKLDDTTAEISSILENSYGISIFSLDRDLRYRVFNSHHKFQTLTEFDIEITRGMSFDYILAILPDRGMEVGRILQSALKGTHTSTEIYYDTPDRERNYLDAIFSPLYSQDEIIGVTVILINTTQRRHLEKEAEIFKTVADNAEYGVMLTDLQFNVRYMNSYWGKIFSLNNHESLHMNVADFIAKSVMKQITDAIDSIRNSGISQQLELDITNTNETVTVLMNCVLYNEIDGEPDGIAFTCLDITPMREAREALIIARNNAERSSLLKSSFVANMSHEIRTPLNAILGFAGLLNGRAETPEMKNYVGSILSSSSILKDLINDILDFSKIEAGKMTFMPEECRIDVFLKDIFDMFRLQTKQKNLYFEFKSLSSIPETLVFDPTRMRQILLNLLGNAVKFTKWGYIKLLLHYNAESRHFSLTISDTGIGIDRKSRKEIFNPFEQQEKQDARHFEGTGLGLAITNKLVFLMKGRIHLSSDPWIGSRFTIKIPIESPDSSRQLDLLMVEDQDRIHEDIKCYAEEGYLTADLLKLAGNSVHFVPLRETVPPSDVIETASPCILTGNPERYSEYPRAVLIEVLNKEELPGNNVQDNRFFISSDLKASKKLAIIKSIMLNEASPLSDAFCEDDQFTEDEMDLIDRALKTRDFTDIETILPLLGKCSGGGETLVAELRKSMDSFDIKDINRKMERIRTMMEVRR